MIGKIVEVDGREQLYIVADFKSNEEYWIYAYSREYFLYPYNSELPDDITIDLSTCERYEVKGTKLTVNVREDKMSYTQYGHSKIRKVKKVMLERIWPEIKIPTR